MFDPERWSNRQPPTMMPSPTPAPTAPSGLEPLGKTPGKWVPPRQRGLGPWVPPARRGLNPAGARPARPTPAPTPTPTPAPTQASGQPAWSQLRGLGYSGTGTAAGNRSLLDQLMAGGSPAPDQSIDMMPSENGSFWYPPDSGFADYGASPSSPWSFQDPMASFLSAVPLMDLNAKRAIGDAMADAGFSGNRYGTYAAERAAQIGAENSLAQNQLLLSTLADFANQEQNRALQATGMGLQAAGLQDEMAQNRFLLPFQLGAWEQGRQDQFGRLGYEDFERNKLGWFPYLLQAATSQGAGSPGQIYTTQDPAKPGAADWISLLAGLFG